jgi:hypothetical protein
MNWVRETRRWLYLNLLVLVAFVVIGSLARSTLIAQGPPPPALVCLKVGCDDPPNEFKCRNCGNPGAVCQKPVDTGRCTQQAYPVGCACK